MVTQCPIQPGNDYTYRFKITKQEGTLWYHAHFSWVRTTVHGALIIRPRAGNSYPFPKPYKEIPILLAEWWNANVIDVENFALATGANPNISDAYTINGKPGSLYACSDNQTYTLRVKRGKTYLLRIINAALNTQLFFRIANHNMTVVAIDATYTNQYVTDTVVTGPGQTVDVLLTADQPIDSYYMAAKPYISIENQAYDNTTTRGVLEYEESTSATPIIPTMPDFFDTDTVVKFSHNLTSLVGARHWIPVPRDVDEEMFMTFGFARSPCSNDSQCLGPDLTSKLSAAMNNNSFVLPTTLSMLQAFYYNLEEQNYETDFPDKPLVEYNYTDNSINANVSMQFAPKTRKVKKLKFNSTVNIVLQNEAFLGIESHPMHLHGYNFHVLGQGFGNYDNEKDSKNFNFDNPQIRNTLAVTRGGWAVIRFQADNPGVWIFHCHLDAHLPIGLGTAFVVENGPTLATSVPPPPRDLPEC
jgi:laccase